MQPLHRSDFKAPIFPNDNVAELGHALQKQHEHARERVVGRVFILGQFRDFQLVL